MNLYQWARVKKTVDGVETHWLSTKEKVLSAMVSKGGHAESVLEDKGFVTINFI